jgi:hypothetical protein
LALVSRQRLRLLLEQPNVNAISGVAMLRGLAAIEESWIGAGGLQGRLAAGIVAQDLWCQNSQN